MNEKDYKLAMFYLDKMIECLDEIAIKVGHPTFKEYYSTRTI